MVEKMYCPKSMVFQWHITERCNNRCGHCYQEDYSEEELQFKDLMKILNQFKDLLNLWSKAKGHCVRGHVRVTGGEPFVREDFLDLLDVISRDREYFSFSILTNGSFIDANMARRLRRLHPASVQVSIDGAESTHDKIRGYGDFDRTVSGVKHLVREGIYTAISFTAHRANFREFADVARLGRRSGAARVWGDRLVPWGAGKAFKERVLTPTETREFFEIMHNASIEANRWWFRWFKFKWFKQCEITMHRALQFLVVGGKPYHCAAGDTLVTVQPNGDLYPCRRMPIRVGNLMETRLAELYYKSDLLRALRDRYRISEGCQGCFYARLCRGGLKCLSYSMTGNPFNADPGCWHAGRMPEH